MQNNDTTTLSLANIMDSPENIANPYPIYHQLRAAAPVLWDERAGGWTVTRHADVVAGLRDARFSTGGFALDESMFPEELRPSIGPAARALSHQMLFLDPPDHTRLRSLAAKAFTPRVVEAMRSRIENIVNEILDAALAKGGMDAIAEFAYPLPAIVIAEILGVPPEDRDKFTEWTGSFGTLLGATNLTPEIIIQSLQGVSEFIEYFRQIIQQHRAHPKNDLMQEMIAAEEQGDRLSEEELLANCVLLLAAGHGTTTHLLGNGLLALMRNPEQLQILRNNPSIISNAVNELLRYDSPVQLTSRRATADLELGGKQVSAGQEVFFVLGAANRDPEQFSNPDQLDLRRQKNPLLSFGHGIHFCLGAPLARLEGEIAFSTFMRRIPSFHLDEPVTLQWSQSLVFRGLGSLPIVFT